MIYSIEPQRVVINNNGAKECLELASGTFAKPPGSDLAGVTPAASQPAPSDQGGGGDCGGGSTYSLESSYVEQSLGPGFAKILDSGRLVPHNEDNRMIGFKLIGVKGGSLFTRIGLSSGDVITRVNDASMAEPDQGFALYQALQDAHEIRIDVLKGGKSPCNITVGIK